MPAPARRGFALPPPTGSERDRRTRTERAEELGGLGLDFLDGQMITGSPDRSTSSMLRPFPAVPSGSHSRRATPPGFRSQCHAVTQRGDQHDSRTSNSPPTSRCSRWSPLYLDRLHRHIRIGAAEARQDIGEEIARDQRGHAEIERSLGTVPASLNARRAS